MFNEIKINDDDTWEMKIHKQKQYKQCNIFMLKVENKKEIKRIVNIQTTKRNQISLRIKFWLPLFSMKCRRESETKVNNRDYLFIYTWWRSHRHCFVIDLYFVRELNTNQKHCVIKSLERELEMRNMQIVIITLVLMSLENNSNKFFAIEAQ